MVGAAAVFLLPRPADLIVWDTSEKKGTRAHVIHIRTRKKNRSSLGMARSVSRARRLRRR
jgi:hypothetical protein